jgi:hypothetical protein
MKITSSFLAALAFSGAMGLPLIPPRRGSYLGAKQLGDTSIKTLGPDSQLIGPDHNSAGSQLSTGFIPAKNIETISISMDKMKSNTEQHVNYIRHNSLYGIEYLTKAEENKYYQVISNYTEIRQDMKALWAALKAAEIAHPSDEALGDYNTRALKEERQVHNLLEGLRDIVGNLRIDDRKTQRSVTDEKREYHDASRCKANIQDHIEHDPATQFKEEPENIRMCKLKLVLLEENKDSALKILPVPQDLHSLYNISAASNMVQNKESSGEDHSPSSISKRDEVSYNANDTGRVNKDIATAEEMFTPEQRARLFYHYKELRHIRAEIAKIIREHQYPTRRSEINSTETSEQDQSTPMPLISRSETKNTFARWIGGTPQQLRTVDSGRAPGGNATFVRRDSIKENFVGLTNWPVLEWLACVLGTCFVMPGCAAVTG